MTVDELINELQEFDGDTKVVFKSTSGEELVEVDAVAGIVENPAVGIIAVELSE
jgi:hypothetical protein